MQRIGSYLFDLNRPVYLTTPRNKFWQVILNYSELRFRAGVIRVTGEAKIIEVQKDYYDGDVAKATAIDKISQKLKKGYVSGDAQMVQNPPEGKRPVSRRNSRKKKEEQNEETRDNVETTPKKRQSQRKKTVPQATAQDEKEDLNKRLWKGLQLEQEAIQFQAVGNQVKTTKKNGRNIRSQIKNFVSFSEALDYILHEQAFYSKQGFKPMISPVLQKKDTIKKTKQEGGLTAMTDNAMWTNSNLMTEQSGPNVYLPNPMLGPPLDTYFKCLLAENYKEQIDPMGWIMSEKLDGLRCLWTGNEMYSRNGNKFYFPQFFTKNWPNSPLDGEIFIGRGKFSQTLSAVKKNVPVASQWVNLKYLVFDAPGVKQPFKRRIKIIEQELSKIDNPFIKCHAHRPCQGFPDLFRELDQVIKAGGQGIMLRNPESQYEGKRSKNLLKVKVFHDDQAQIVGYTQGTGRCLGWIGALKVRNSKGIQFEVGSGLNDEMRKNPPDIGTFITYKYQEFNKESGKPRFPTFLRIHEKI